MENKRHEIETIQDIVDVVNVDNFENFLKDFRGFLGGYMMAQAASDIAYESKGEDKKPIPISKFTWIDDGVVDVKIKISSKENPDDYVEIHGKESETKGEKS